MPSCEGHQKQRRAAQTEGDGTVPDRFDSRQRGDGSERNRNLKERHAISEAMMLMQQAAGLDVLLVALVFLGMGDPRKVSLFASVPLAFTINGGRRRFAEGDPRGCGGFLKS